MFSYQCLRWFKTILAADSSPKSVAAGVASGFLVGMVPKGNLLAIVLMIVVSSFRVSLPTLFFAAFLFTWAAWSFEAWLAAIGEAVLTFEPLVPYWISLYDMPLIPWTSFNQTIVMGGLVIGVVGWLPVYHLSYYVWVRCWAMISARTKDRIHRSCSSVIGVTESLESSMIIRHRWFWSLFGHDTDQEAA